MSHPVSKEKSSSLSDQIHGVRTSELTPIRHKILCMMGGIVRINGITAEICLTYYCKSIDL